MKVREFINLVKEMRGAQKGYFSSRSQVDLKRSKNLEVQVDQIIDAALGAGK